MSLLSEDPWPLVWVCAFVAVFALAATRFTGRGKYLWVALVAVALAAVLLAIDAFWVTDRERIESVVHEIASAVRRSDADATLKHVAKDVVLEQGTEQATVAHSEAAIAMMRALIKATCFESL